MGALLPTHATQVGNTGLGRYRCEALVIHFSRAKAGFKGRARQHWHRKSFAVALAFCGTLTATES